MKTFLKRILPEFLKREIRVRKSRFRGRTTEQIFTEIFTEGAWQCDGTFPVSGPGSSLRVTRELRNGLQAFIDQYRCTSIVDLGCGDFSWMSTMDLTGISYVGFDVVPQLIESNRRLHGSRLRRFEVGDAAHARIGECDLLICRDCLVHLSFAEIEAVLSNLLSCGARFVALTHFPGIDKNIDIQTGQWRPLNLTLAPVGLGSPTECIADGLGQDELCRVLGVWEQPGGLLQEQRTADRARVGQQ